METVIKWTRYDGTEATLPSNRQLVMFITLGSNTVYGPATVWGHSYGVRKLRWCEESADTYVHIGDLWAPWPAAPQE